MREIGSHHKEEGDGSPSRTNSSEATKNNNNNEAFFLSVRRRRTVTFKRKCEGAPGSKRRSTDETSIEEKQEQHKEKTEELVAHGRGNGSKGCVQGEERSYGHAARSDRMALELVWWLTHPKPC